MTVCCNASDDMAEQRTGPAIARRDVIARDLIDRKLFARLHAGEDQGFRPQVCVTQR